MTRILTISYMRTYFLYWWKTHITCFRRVYQPSVYQVTWQIVAQNSLACTTFLLGWSILWFPDCITNDVSKTFMDSAFQTNADMLHIRTNFITVESANSMTIVDRYYAPARCASNIIQNKALGIEREDSLELPVKAINDSVGPTRLVLKLLVHGALARSGCSSDALT